MYQFIFSQEEKFTSFEGEARAEEELSLSLSYVIFH